MEPSSDGNDVFAISHLPPMKHSLSATGYGIRLRPVKVDDAEFIIHLRNLPHVLGTVGDTVPDIAAQKRWIETSLDRAGDFYFVIESCQGKELGTIAIYDVADGVGEWGRWITLPGMLIGLSSAVLIHDLAFDQLNLSELRGCVVSENLQVLSFHRRFGLEETGIELHARKIGGTWVDLVWFAMNKEKWNVARSRLHLLAETATKATTDDM